MTRTDPLDTARTAVQRGFVPIPLHRKAKRPVNTDWTKTDPADAVSIMEAALESDPHLNVGLVLGNGTVDIDLDHHRAITVARTLLPHTDMKHGRATARQSHWWYRITDDYPLGLKQYKMPDGSVIIEYRAKGGQTMIPPSFNPDHDETAVWEGEAFGGEVGPASVKGGLLHAQCATIAMLVLLAEAWPKRGGRHEAYLALVGGLLRDADDTGAPRLHPIWNQQIEGLVRVLASITHDEDGGSARVAESVHSTRAKILKGDKVRGWPTLAGLLDGDGEAFVTAARSAVVDVEEITGTPRGRIRREADEDDGNWKSEPTHSAALSAVPDGAVEILDDEEEFEERGTWKIISEHDKWLDADGNLISPIEPGVLFREDGLGIFYPGRINMLYGPSESGKSLIAMTAALHEIEAGGRALMIDLENGYDEIHERLQNLGFPGGQRTGGWGYIEAEQPIASLQRDTWGGIVSTDTGRLNKERFRDSVLAFDPTLILLDGTTTLFTMHGLDPNKATGVDTITSWLRSLCEHGKRTVILIDHTNKNPKPGDLPTGSQHKKSMVQGTMLQVHGESPEVGQETNSYLYAVKDRPGKVKREGFKDADGVRAADAVFRGFPDGTVRVEIVAPDPDAVLIDFSNVKPPGRPKENRAGDVRAVRSVFEKAGAGTLVTRAAVAQSLDKDMPDGRLRDAIKSLVEAGAVQMQGAGRSVSYCLI